MILLNPRGRRRHRRTNRSFHAPRRSHRRHRRNAGFLAMNPFRGSLGTVTKGFSTSAIGQAVPLAVGVLANRYLQDKAAEMVGHRIGVDLSHGWKNTLTGTVTAGALGMVPKYGGPLFAGAMMQVAIKALLPFIPGMEDLKPVPPPPPAPAAPRGPQFSGMDGHWAPEYDEFSREDDNENAVTSDVRPHYLNPGVGGHRAMPQRARMQVIASLP